MKGKYPHEKMRWKEMQAGELLSRMTLVFAQKTTLRSGCSRNSTLLWVFSVKTLLMKGNSFVSKAFLSKLSKITIGIPFCHKCHFQKTLCAVVLLSFVKWHTSPRLLMCFLHTSFCYGGGYFWVRGLGAAQWGNIVKSFKGMAISLQPC